MSTRASVDARVTPWDQRRAAADTQPVAPDDRRASCFARAWATQTTGRRATVKNIDAPLNAIQAVKAPPKLTQRFLEDLRLTNDRLYINVVKALGLLSPDGAPTSRYYGFLDPSWSGRVLAEAFEDAYADLFQLRRDAYRMDRPELRGRIKTAPRAVFATP